MPTTMSGTAMAWPGPARSSGTGRRSHGGDGRGGPPQGVRQVRDVGVACVPLGLHHGHGGHHDHDQDRRRDVDAHAGVQGPPDTSLRHAQQGRDPQQAQEPQRPQGPQKEQQDHHQVHGVGPDELPPARGQVEAVAQSSAKTTQMVKLATDTAVSWALVSSTANGRSRTSRPVARGSPGGLDAFLTACPA